ncbi:hypothetical protein LINPERHAP2_LOCUS38801 [Linum perenne]
MAAAGASPLVVSTKTKSRLLRRSAATRRRSAALLRRSRVAGAGGGVGMKVKKLRKLIPGGEGMEADRLLLKTADYILHLS